MNATAATLSRQIGAILVQKGLITAAQLEQALQRQESTGAWLGEIVVGEFGVSQDDLNRVLAEVGRAGFQERQVRDMSEQAAEQEPLTAAEVRLRRPIGEIFVELGFISDDQLQGALAVQKTTGARIGEILVEQGILTRLDLASALAEHWESGQPAPAVTGLTSQNGGPMAPEPARLEDGAASTDVELLPAVVGEHVEPERPARRTWRRRGRSATAEDSPPQAWIEDSPPQARTDDSPPQAPRGAGEARPADPGDLEVKIDDLGRLFESLAEARVGDALATGARLAAVEAALESLAGMELRIRESVGREPEDRPDHLGPRLELLESRLDGLAVLEKRVAVLAAATVEVGAELHALTDRPAIPEPGGQLLEFERKLETTAAEGRKRIGEVAAELRSEVRARATDLGSELEVQRGETAAVRARVAEIQKAAAGAEQATAALRSETTSLGVRIDELHEVRRADMEALCAANELLGERLAALAVSREGDAHASRNGTRELEEERRLRQDLLAGLDRVEASLGQRLELIEESRSSEDWERLKATVAELERRLDEQAAIGEEQARASERAIRKGLASLGKRIVGPDSRYAGAGKGLRRSIERLGAAVVEAEARMADQIPVSEVEGCVAFAPTAAGYRLVELPGRPPEIGSTVELDGCDGPLVVTRYGRSPLPFDSRPCAYLGRD